MKYSSIHPWWLGLQLSWIQVSYFFTLASLESTCHSCPRVELTVYFTIIFGVSGKIQVANKKMQFFSFPPKIHQLVAMLLPICNQKLKWDSMYLIFLHILYKFYDCMMIFKGPTSIIAFGGKIKQLFF